MKTTTNTILVPVDFGDQSIIALQQTYNLARLTGAEITILHVILENGPIWGVFSQKERDGVKEKLQAKLDYLAKETEGKAGVKVNTILEKGKLIEKILEVSDNINARLLMVGTTISNDIRQKIIGSNAMRLVKEAKCPVITIKGKHHRDGCENIILPLDLTKETKQKISTAIQFASYFNARIFVVSAVSTSDEYLINKQKKQLEEVRSDITLNGVDCKVEMIHCGSSNEEKAIKLIGYSHKLDGDIIIMMTQQEYDIVDYFVGSLAKYMIHSSDIPIMSIIPKKGMGIDAK